MREMGEGAIIDPSHPVMDTRANPLKHAPPVPMQVMARVFAYHREE
jgi:hypothetical protein